MTFRQLLEGLVAAGGTLALHNGRVRLTAPSGRLSEALLRDLRAKEDEVRRFLEARQGDLSGRIGLGSCQRPRNLPLSYAQQRLWFVDRLERGTSTQYNVLAGHRLRGPLDRGALERAINMIVERHESLRTHFEETGGGPVQVIEPVLRIPLAVEDLSELGEAEQQKRIADAMRLERKRAFDLASGPLLRTKLLKVGEQEHILLRAMHHIVSDGWSQAVLNRELLVLYEAYREGRGNPLKPLPVQYADFALWQRERLEGGALEEGLAYWKNQLEGMPERLELPTDRPRPAVQTFEAEVCETSLSAELSEALRRLSRENQATQYMTLLAAFAVLLSRYSGQDDIVVGSPIANRQEQQLEDLIGFFVNMLVMRVRVKGDKTFRELLHDVRKTALEAYQHQDVPFERLVEELVPERNLNTTPLYQVLFAIEHLGSDKSRSKEIMVKKISCNQLRVGYDIEVHIYEVNGTVDLYWGYNRDLFDRWRIEQMVRHYVRILEEVTADSEQDVGSIDLLSDEERRRMLEEYNDTGREASRATLPELFEAQVERTPEAIAVVYQDRRLTYSELNRRKHELARYLVGLGVVPEDTVGIFMDRSELMVVAVLAVLTCGAAYVPFDVGMPSKRIELVRKAVNCKIILTQSKNFEHLPSEGGAVVAIDAMDGGDHRDNPNGCMLTRRIVDSMAAYVLYTSGSTGLPKGVVVEHRQIVNYLLGFKERTGFAKPASFAMVQPLFVDSSATVLYAAIIGGACLHIIPEDMAGDSAALAQYFQEESVDCLKIAPSHLAALQSGSQPEGFLPRRLLVVGGEKSRQEWLGGLKETVPSCAVFNHYGPTETTVGVLMHRVRGRDTDSQCEVTPIGRPLVNVKAYVFDAYLQPTPTGVGGELYIGGAGIARGYLGLPGLTAERFVADLYGDAGDRMYRTGDLVKRLQDGALEFMGRVDDQVKIRGFRVELGEIETVIRGLEYVRDAVVVAQEDEWGAKSLSGYVVVDEDSNLGLESVLRRLRERLPEYMVPRGIVLVDELPLTPHGKVDRKALPAATPVSLNNVRLAQTSDEKLLCGLMADLLKVDQVGLDSNFFELGGHSLLAMTLVNRVRATTGVELALREIFMANTVEDICTTLTLALAASAKTRAANESTDQGIEERYL